MPYHSKHDQIDGVTLKAEVPECPSWLDDLAVKEWSRITAILGPLNVLTQLDQSALATYCALFSEQQQKGHGFQAGKLSQLRLLMVELGLTPVSRNKLRVIHAPKINPFIDDFDDTPRFDPDEFLKGMKKENDL